MPKISKISNRVFDRFSVANVALLSEFEMSDRVRCEFFIIRYVPDLVRGEFVNIGVLIRQLTDAVGDGPAAMLRFTNDWSRVLALDPDADTEMLEVMGSELSTRFESELSKAAYGESPESVFSQMRDSFSGAIQLSECQPVLAESMAAGASRLMRLYVEPNLPD